MRVRSGGADEVIRFLRKDVSHVIILPLAMILKFAVIVHRVIEFLIRASLDGAEPIRPTRRNITPVIGIWITV